MARKKGKSLSGVPNFDTDIDAFIGEGTLFEGTFAFTGVVRIDGMVRGEVRCNGTLIVGETGKIWAKVETKNGVIRGRIEGEINATERLELKYPSVVEGNVTARDLIVESGVVISGKVKSGYKDERREP